MTESDLPADVKEARARIRREEEGELIRMMVNAATTFSPAAEAASTWFLGATGAGAAFLVPHLDKASELLGATGARLCLGLLVLSTLFGLAGRRLGMLVQYQRAMTNVMLAELPKIYDKYTAYYESAAPGTAHLLPRADFNIVTTAMIESAPWLIRWRVRRGTRQGAQDNLLTFRKAQNFFGWQMLCLDAQWFTFGLAIVTAAFLA